jgi:uncharacterized membrane protein
MLLLLSSELLVLLTAATPVIELRGAIPLGIALGLPIAKTWGLAFIGNLLPIPFILLGIEYLLSQLKKLPAIHGWILRLRERGSDKLMIKIRRWGWLGLIVFVAIPLPGTGAWTGALAASFLGLKFWPSLFSISIGIAVAGFLVSGIGIGVLHLF